MEWLRPFVASGAVLDLGCIDERHPERIASSLHGRLLEINPNVVGADVDEAAIQEVAKIADDWDDVIIEEAGGLTAVDKLREVRAPKAKPTIEAPRAGDAGEES